MILTGRLVRRAVELVKPTALAILNAEGMTWGPKFVVGLINCPTCTPAEIPFQFGEKPKSWDKKWGEEKNFAQIAAEKLKLAKREHGPTSLIVAATPWVIQEGEYLYAGGTSFAGISVAVSGAKGRVDEAIAEMVIFMIVLLARLEADKRIAEGQNQI